jgi:hypothetical protein
MEHRLQIQFASRPSDKMGEPWPQRYCVSFGGKEIGVWKDPESSAARWLIEHGRAAKEDTLQFYRGDDPAFRGQVGWLADRAVREDANHSPTFVKWRPFPVTRRLPRTPKKRSEAPSAQSS